MMLLMLFIKLLLAHVLGDFILQPDSWVREKEHLKIKSPKIYYHILIHGLLSFILVADIHFWPFAILIALSHGLIDLIKLYFQKPKNKSRWFWVDQLLHLIILWIICALWKGEWISVLSLFTDRNIALFTAILILTKPSAIIIKTIISKWTPSYSNTIETNSLHNAGKYIGILERLFILVFILSGHFEGVGFLLAAKSIFRFGDLKDAKDRKLTEYVMIGTFLSFGIAMLVAILLKGTWLSL